MIRSAIFSRNGNYRYVLERQWDRTLPSVMIIGLNPSIADGQNDDPTIKKCIRMSRNWGFGSLIMTNLFAWKATDPNDLLMAEKPIGYRNNWSIKKCLSEVDEIVCAWGNHGQYRDRAFSVCRWLPDSKAISINKSGMPAHPLYQKDNAQLIDFNLL